MKGVIKLKTGTSGCNFFSEVVYNYGVCGWLIHSSRLVPKEESLGLTVRRQVLALNYIEDVSAEEISQVLNKSTKSVERLLNRTRLVPRNESFE